MAALAQATFEGYFTTISGATFTATQVAQAQSLMYQLLKVLYGPAATSTVLLDGALGATGAASGGAG